MGIIKKKRNRIKAILTDKEKDACINMPARNSKGRFKKGHSGNPKGRRKKVIPKPRHTVSQEEFIPEEHGFYIIYDSDSNEGSSLL